MMFRVMLVTLGLVVGVHAAASTLAELSSLDRAPFPSDPAKINSPSAAAVPGWLEIISPFRSDLESNHALILALQTLQSGSERSTPEESARNAGTQARAKQTLSVAPYHPELWLALALLKARKNPRDPMLIEALKMSYFTAPNDARLMAVRLDLATSSNALADPDVRELARGDVRLILLRRPELRPAVASAYRRASTLGKAFLDDAIRSIDPSFLAALRG
jgi:hypothetical protein